MLISYFDAEVEAGNLAAEAHPVKSISKYDETSGMQGVGGEVMESRFCIILLLEFVGLERKVVDRVNPPRTNRVQGLPQGSVKCRRVDHWNARA